MGREVKRVPLDFDHPMDVTWPGFLMPESLDERACMVCRDSDGLTVEARAIADTFYAHKIDSPRASELAWSDKIGQAEVDNLLAEGRLTTLVKRTPTEDNPRDWEWAALPRTAVDVNAEQRRGGLGGHDAINRWILIRFRCERLGIKMECSACNGHGHVEVYPGQRAEAEAWERTEPPTGDGWQMWQTVGEGSPISPVFATPEGLAEWLGANGNARWRTGENTAEQWLKMILAGWAPSGAIIGGEFMDGVAAVASR